MRGPAAEFGGRGRDLLVALIVADREGRYFAIGMDELDRFRVPGAYGAALESLTHGAKPIPADADVSGFGDAAILECARLLLDRMFGDGDAGRTPPATRRLSAWVLLR